MASAAFHKRPYDAFLSHAHVDREAIVNRLHDWLQNVCNLQVWFDAKHLPPGAAIASCLDDIVTQARAMLIVLSQSSVKSGWVKQELRVAKDQRNRHDRFRIVGVRIDDVELPEDQQIELWLDAPEGKLTLESALLLLAGLHGDGFRNGGSAGRDVYVSRGWGEADDAPATSVIGELTKLGLRPVGDAREHRVFDGPRIQGIISSCVAHVCVIPNRGQRSFSEYFDSELRWSAEAKVPQLILSDPASLDHLPSTLVGKAHAFDYIKLAARERGEIQRLINELNWIGELQAQPLRGHCFFATDFAESNHARNDSVKALIEGLTGLVCLTGHDITEGSLQREIIQRISASYFMVADVSEENVNTCVEAGIGRALGTRLFLVAKGPPRRPVFMFRDWQVQHYTDDFELLGRIHRAVYPFRRWVMAPN
jgi:hypothetical protein